MVLRGGSHEMDCLACFDLKAIFELFLSTFGKITSKYKNIRKFMNKKKILKNPPPHQAKFRQYSPFWAIRLKRGRSATDSFAGSGPDLGQPRLCLGPASAGPRRPIVTLATIILAPLRIASAVLLRQRGQAYDGVTIATGVVFLMSLYSISMGGCQAYDGVTIATGAGQTFWRKGEKCNELFLMSLRLWPHTEDSKIGEIMG